MTSCVIMVIVTWHNVMLKSFKKEERMKIYTKNGVFDLELDGISSKGNIKFSDGTKMKLREIYNWIDVLADFAENISCFDSVACGGNSGIVLLDDLYISHDDPIGELCNASNKIQSFLEVAFSVGLSVSEIIYCIGQNNEYLSCEVFFEFV